ncbi:DNA ligase [Streptomyces sp. NPDC056975]|uniref:ATP-dependent DNA ligase n=1 Tax=Streptomyces sp. NPDC056975 TaxID=3345985 RepID=UPI00363E9465
MEFPVQLALAQPVTVLPTGKGWWYEPKMDGHRTALWRDADTVRLQARSGRAVTAAWMDIALAGMALPPGTVLDGECVVWVEGRIDFSAAQSRAASSPIRARELAARWPASYAVWDVLQHPTLGDVRPRPYSERRALMLDLLEDRPPIQALPATDDPETALLWYEALRETGVEGIVCKRADGAYRGGKRSWLKLRHSDTVNAEVIGYTGPASRPRALAVRLPDGRIALSQTLPGPLAAHLGTLLAGSGPPRRAHTPGGDSYNTVPHDLVVVEVLAGTTRHAVVTVTRLR